MLSEEEFLDLARQREHELLPCPFLGCKPTIDLEYISRYGRKPTSQAHLEYPETVITVGNFYRIYFDYVELTEETLDKVIQSYNCRATKTVCPKSNSILTDGDCTSCNQYSNCSK